MNRLHVKVSGDGRALFAVCNGLRRLAEWLSLLVDIEAGTIRFLMDGNRVGGLVDTLVNAQLPIKTALSVPQPRCCG